MRMNEGPLQIYLPKSEPSSASQRHLELPPATQVNLEDVEDFSNVCRICATVTELVIPIFNGEGLLNNLAEKICKHLPIKVSTEDVLPRVVCCQCSSTILAWHELVQCSLQAEQALHTRLLTVRAAQDNKPHPNNVKSQTSTRTDQDNKWKPCFKNETESSSDSDTDRRYSPIKHGVDVSDESDNSLDDDKPLSVVATKKSNNIYNKFYKALINFRDHYVSDHDKCSYPEFTDSSPSEESLDENNDESNNIESFDDLTQWNMRKDRMDDETRLELSQVQTKINGKVFYTCKICGKNLSSSHTYVFHKRIHTGERPCVCHICGKQFRAPNGLQRHLTETHERARRHSCLICLKNFANSQNLKQHMRIHTGERPFICSHCGKRFTQSGSLHVHLKTHSEQFPHQCAECGAKFRVRAGLARHRLKHSGERPHVCGQCGRGFRQRHELAAHALAHTDAKPHACALCPATFRQRRALRHHTKRMHETDLPTHPIVYDHVGPY